MKLLVAISDRSYEPQHLDLVAKLAGNDPVVLAHAMERRASPRGAAGGAQALQLEAPALLAAQRELAARGVTTEIATEHGSPTDVLPRLASQRSADVIVLRAHDRSPKLLRRVFGDTVTHVLERADRPVLALRTGAAAEGRGILLASGRPGATLLDTTALVARATSSPVTVLHVEPQGENEDLFRDVFQRPDERAPDHAPKHVLGVERAVEALRARRVDAGGRLRAGLVEDQLAREANEGDHWLLVVRGRSVGRIWRAVLGHSFTEDLVRHVRTSILVVK